MGSLAALDVTQTILLGRWQDFSLVVRGRRSKAWSAKPAGLSHRTAG